MRILVCDGLDKAGVEILRSTPGIEVDERPSISAEELAEIIGDYEGLIIRSKTKAKADIIEREPNYVSSVERVPVSITLMYRQQHGTALS